MLLTSFTNCKILKKIIVSKDKDEKLILQFDKEMKKMIKNFVLTIPNYQFNMYGDEKELN
jgi:hypothetical protein